nr:probable E3 ubiquitin-protein ligase RHY1A [Ipomoea batatas]
MLCFGVADPRTVVIIEVVLKYKRWIFLSNRRGQLVDFYETNSDSYACFDSPGLSYSDLRAQIRLWMPGMSPSLCTHLSQRIFVYVQQVAFANADHHINENGGANKVTAFVEIEELEVQPDYDEDDDDEDDDDDEEDDDDVDDESKPPRSLSWDEINGLKQETFKNGTAVEEGSLMCSICLEDFSAGVKITPLPCSHTFHHNCIASWLLKQASCPLCRFDISQEC